MRKRSLQSIAAVLTLVMSLTIAAPTVALAKPHRDGGHRPKYHDRYHDRNRDRDYDRDHHRKHSRHKNAYLWGLGLGIVGGAFFHKNTNRPVVTHIAVYDYDMYKNEFISDLDNDELELYYYLSSLEPNAEGRNYRHFCERSITKRRLTKIIKALYEDYQFLRAEGDYIHFIKFR